MSSRVIPLIGGPTTVYIDEDDGGFAQQCGEEPGQYARTPIHVRTGIGLEPSVEVISPFAGGKCLRCDCILYWYERTVV